MWCLLGWERCQPTSNQFDIRLFFLSFPLLYLSLSPYVCSRNSSGWARIKSHVLLFSFLSLSLRVHFTHSAPLSLYFASSLLRPKNIHSSSSSSGSSSSSKKRMFGVKIILKPHATCLFVEFSLTPSAAFCFQNDFSFLSLSLFYISSSYACFILSSLADATTAFTMAFMRNGSSSSSTNVTFFLSLALAFCINADLDENLKAIKA